MTDLRVQTGWLWDAEFIGYFIAAELGYYASAGLEVTFLEGGPAVDPEQVLLEGAADLSIGIPDSVAARVARGDELTIVGRQYRRDPLAVIVSASSSARTLHDLRGMRLFVPEVSRVRVTAALHSAGLSDVEVAFSSPEDRPAPLRDAPNSAVVGYATSLPADMVAAGDGPLRAIPVDAPDTPTVQNAIVAAPSILRAHGREVDRFLESSTFGWAVNAGDPDRFPRSMRYTWFSRLDRSLNDEIEHNRRQQAFLAPDLRLDPAALASLERVGRRHGISGATWYARA